MVTKQSSNISSDVIGLILAKNHMVTKHYICSKKEIHSLILAKNHMVTKPVWNVYKF